MTLQEWSDKRAKLNHDLLNNRIRNVLGSLASDASNCLDELFLLQMWVSREAEYVAFIKAASDVLSTANIFVESPLAQSVCEDNLIEWRQLAHQLFLAGTGIAARIADLEMRLKESVGLANQLLAEKSAERRKEVAAALFASTEKLSSGISALPANVIAKIGPIR